MRVGVPIPRLELQHRCRFQHQILAVADRCKGHLQDFISIHDIQPLPAHDENHVLIQYESKLKGALIEVHVAIYHHLIKSKKRDVFNVELQKLIVLSPPATMLSSPFKHRHLDAGSCAEQRNKGKEHSLRLTLCWNSDDSEGGENEMV
ncbi:hypothetical protein M405DRAFT_407862 [Rhizopogon salebrosus TDB-379]|nr:hypothetical protein M405DRAFT_407862 [Rhizopogon salebrosus TDB-379]